MRTWNKLVEQLRSCIVESVEERDLDTVTVLRIVRSTEMRHVVVNATMEDQRKLAIEIIQLLMRAAEHERCSWMRTALATAADHCTHAIQAYEWTENEKREQPECLCCAAVAAHTEARSERCPECGKEQPVPNPDDAPNPPNDLESETS